jgi:hypothetical protein
MAMGLCRAAIHDDLALLILSWSLFVFGIFSRKNIFHEIGQGLDGLLGVGALGLKRQLSALRCA